MSFATAGYKGSLKLPGAALAMNNEAMGPIDFPDPTAFTVWQITDPAKQLVDWTQNVVVEGNLGAGFVVLSPTVYVLDPLFGIVKITDPLTEPTALRITGFYRPIFTLALCREVSLDDTTAELDVTVFGDTYTRRIYGLQDVSASVSGFNPTNLRLDGPTGTQATLKDLLRGRNTVVLCYKPDETGNQEFRAVLNFTSQSLSQPVDGLMESTLELVGAAPNFRDSQVALSYIDSTGF